MENKYLKKYKSFLDYVSFEMRCTVFLERKNNTVSWGSEIQIHEDARRVQQWVWDMKENTSLMSVSAFLGAKVRNTINTQISQFK